MPEPSDTPWSPEGRSRTGSGRSVRIDPATPLRGIVVANQGHHDLLLGLELAGAASPITDRWLRGRDLTVTCEPADGRLLRATVTWRQREESGGIDAWEAIVSAQTSSLDSDATLSVVSDVQIGELLARGTATHWTRSGGGRPMGPDVTAVLARRPATSVLLGVHPIDLRRIDVEVRDSVARIDVRLFAAAVEKGVLLRSRVVAAIGPRDGDEAWAASLLAAFAASTAPLTT